MWLHKLGNKNKASRGKQEDITRHGAKSLAQISDKIVKNKLRIHECVHDIFDFFFPIYKVNLILYVLGIRIS